MKRLRELSTMQESNVVVISLHPEHANKILSGNKNLEFRRVWGKKEISAVVIYATAPVQKIIAIAYVKKIHKGSRSYLWALAKLLGGGLTRKALFSYFEGKKEGYAIEFNNIQPFYSPLEPKSVIDNFKAPQSFMYLSHEYFQKLEGLVMSQKLNTGKVIFVSGVHGVGKSSMCEPYSKKHGLIYKSASQLIREAKSDAISFADKTVKDIDGNQQLLIRSVSKITNSGINLLLDGHFAILNQEKQPTAIETSVFLALGINSIITIHDSASDIADRINSRDSNKHIGSDIEKLQTLELTRAKQVAGELKISLSIVRAFDNDSFNSCLDAALN